MSEYSSLYISIQIQQDRLQQFFASAPAAQQLDSDWQAWWDSRAMYGKQPLVQLPTYSIPSNRAVFDRLLKDRHTGSMEHYEPTTQRWTFLSIFFSENYQEILPFLVLLQHLASFQQQTETGFALIYDYFWSDAEVMAQLIFSAQHAVPTHCTATEQIAPAMLQEANAALEAATETFNAQYKD